jgi:K+-dependent Na+/Ca+ exchanger-like protein
MNIYLAVILLLLSFLLIGIIIDKYFIPSLEMIAGWLKMPEDVAGATLLAFGSSAPELFTALLTLLVFRSRPSFGVGNVVGSALFQILVVIGFAALIKRAHLQWRPVLRDGSVYALSVVLLYLLMRDGVFTAWDGVALVGTYGLYLGLLLVWPRFVRTRKPIKKSEAKDTSDRPHTQKVPRSSASARRLLDRLRRPIPDPREKPGWTIPLFLLSLGVIGAGTYIFLRSGEAIAAYLGIDATIIALTIIAGGSSVPELVASAIVARKGKGDMAIANALGSNTFDICISLGLPVLLTTLIYGPVENIGSANITTTTILLLATLLMVLGLLVLQKFRAGRPFGLVLIIGYGLYVVAAFKGWIG